MQTPFDFLAKALIEATAAPYCDVRLQRPVADETLYADAVLDPRADGLEALAGRGMLGRIVCERCLIEPYSRVVRMADVERSLARLLLLRRGLREGFRALWVVSAGRPSGVLREWALRPSARWGAGVYAGESRRAPRIIVVSELATERDTLVLRLMGRDAVLRRAVEDALALPREAWERAFVDRLLLRVGRDLRKMVGGAGVPEEFMRYYQQVIQEEQDRIAEAEARGRAMGEAHGRAVGEAAGRAIGEARGEALGEARGGADALRLVLSARGFTLSEEHERRIAASDLATLRRWVVAAVTATSIEQVFSR